MSLFNTHPRVSIYCAADPMADCVLELLSTLPHVFDSTGTTIYAGRNTIKRFRTGDADVVVKRFRRLGWLRGLVYTYFRKDKALRSMHNAQRLMALGIGTPQPQGCTRVRRGGVVRELYYACNHTDAVDIKTPLIDREPFDTALADAYARFVARLHEQGVLHRDLNPTNVRYRMEGGEYRFELIDLNRMTFYDGPVPKAECMENLTLFWWLTDVYRHILRAYCTERGWSQADYDEAISVKQRHDRRWIRRKNFTAIFKHHQLKRP